MCVHALLGTTALAAGGTRILSGLPFGHASWAACGAPSLQTEARSSSLWNTSPVSAFLLVQAVVKRPEFSLSSKKDACLLFRREEHPRKSQDTETHQGRDTSKAYSLPNDTCVLAKRRYALCLWHELFLDCLPQFLLSYVRDMGKIVRTVQMQQRWRKRQHPACYLTDLVLNSAIFFGLLHDSYYMLSYHLKRKRGKQRLSHAAEGVEKWHWGKVRPMLS